jgi:hypothetical protein
MSHALITPGMKSIIGRRFFFAVEYASPEAGSSAANDCWAIFSILEIKPILPLIDSVMRST